MKIYNKTKSINYPMDYLKKSIKKLNLKRDYEEIDTRLASGWYVDDVNIRKGKTYKTKKITYRVSKKKSRI